MKIGRRLVIVFGIIGAILLTVGAGALWSQRAMSQANRASLDECSANAKAAGGDMGVCPKILKS